MPRETWETSDGKRYESSGNSIAENGRAEADARRDQYYLDEAAKRNGSSSSSSYKPADISYRTSVTGAGNDCFNKGDYVGAVNAYSSIINSFVTEEGRDYRHSNLNYIQKYGSIDSAAMGTLYSNRASARLRLGYKEAAIADLKKAADVDFGNTDALKRLAEAGVQYSPHDTLEKEAMAGNTISQVKLANFYDDGRNGYPEDKSKAVEWYRKAAEAGGAYGQYMLGIKYLHGSGVKKNRKEALKWIRKAAEGRNISAQCVLDRMEKEGSLSYDDDEYSYSSKKLNIIGAIVGGVVGSFIFGFPIGTIIGVIAGWFLGRFLANKFLAIVIIVGLIGGGLYFGRDHIEPIVSPIVASVTGKANLFAKSSTQTVSANVNFRAEPSTDAKIIRTLNQGDTVTVTGAVQGGWSQVSNNGDTGWISTEFLDK